MRDGPLIKNITRYWLIVFACYALIEAAIQLLFFVILNNFGKRPISHIEMHLIMWIFQCALIWPIWWVAYAVRKQKPSIQILVNIGFYFIYSYAWFGPIQEAIGFLYHKLETVSRTPNNRLSPILDNGNDHSYLNYQLLKHAFRLSWYYLAAFFYNYRQEEQQRIQLAVANKDLQLKLLKWHLNPSFYFKTINHLRQLAQQKPSNATAPILQLAKVMEYVIYEAKEKLIDVRKEIHFLSSYIQLLNHQPDNKIRFQVEVKGNYDKLKIAPLLLAGLIDRIFLVENLKLFRQYDIQLQFIEAEMRLDINGLEPGRKLLIPGEVLYKRLKELYPEKFFITHSPFQLMIRLDEE